MNKVVLYLEKLIRKEVGKALKETYNDETSGQSGDITYDQTPWGHPNDPTYDESTLIPIEKVKQILQKYHWSWPDFIAYFPEMSKAKSMEAGDLIDFLQRSRGGTKVNDKELEEATPPGREDQVKKLKQELPKTYTDKSGHKHESNPWAVAWASYNKNESKLEQLVREETSKALTRMKNENKA